MPMYQPEVSHGSKSGHAKSHGKRKGKGQDRGRGKTGQGQTGQDQRQYARPKREPMNPEHSPFAALKELRDSLTRERPEGS